MASSYRTAHSAEGPASDATSRCGRGVEYSGSYRINCVRGALHSLIAACIVAGAILLPCLVKGIWCWNALTWLNGTAATIVPRCVRLWHLIAGRNAAGSFFDIAAAWRRSSRNMPSMRTRRSWTNWDPPIGLPNSGISLEVCAAFPAREGPRCLRSSPRRFGDIRQDQARSWLPAHGADRGHSLGLRDADAG